MCVILKYRLRCQAQITAIFIEQDEYLKSLLQCLRPESGHGMKNEDTVKETAESIATN